MGSLGGVQLITKHRLYSPAAFGGHSAMTSHCIRTLFMVKCSTILPRHKFVYYKYLLIFITHGLVSPEHLALYVRSMLPSGMAPCRKVLTEEMPAYLEGVRPRTAPHNALYRPVPPLRYGVWLFPIEGRYSLYRPSYRPFKTPIQNRTAPIIPV
jgi:hypothetical protein